MHSFTMRQEVCESYFYEWSGRVRSYKDLYIIDTIHNDRISLRLLKARNGKHICDLAISKSNQALVLQKVVGFSNDEIWATQTF